MKQRNRVRPGKRRERSWSTTCSICGSTRWAYLAFLGTSHEGICNRCDAAQRQQRGQSSLWPASETSEENGDV